MGSSARDHRTRLLDMPQTCHSQLAGSRIFHTVLSGLAGLEATRRAAVLGGASNGLAASWSGSSQLGDEAVSFVALFSLLVCCPLTQFLNCGISFAHGFNKFGLFAQ